MASPTLRVHTLIDSLTWGGAEMLLADLAAAAPSAGIEMSVGYLQEVNGSPARPRLRAQGIEPQLVEIERMLDPRALSKVRAHIRAMRPDLLHTHLSISDAIGGLAARTLGIPAVSTIHLIGHATTEPPGARTALRGTVTALARRVGDARIIAVSDATREAYLKRYRERRRRLITVHNGIVAPAVETDRNAVRAALGLSPEAPVVAIVAVLRAGKGHDIALRAIARIQDRFPGLTLLVVGDGPAREQVRALGASLGEKVVFTGHRTDVPALLRAVDVLLHPTSIDAFPTVLLEACAASIPVLATRVGGIPEIVSDGRTGLLVEAPAHPDAVAGGLERLLGDPDLRAEMGAAARVRYLQEFSAERWATRLREVYEQVLGARAGAKR